jgi:hypothetical protein
MKIAMRRIIAAHWSLTWCGVLEAQVPSSARLEVVVQNAVAYVDDGIPYGQYATAQTQTPPATGGRNFRSWTLIGDVVSVNGKPAKGVAVHRAHIVSLRTAPANGQAISDVNGPLAVADYNVEIRHADGTPVGTAMLQGFLFGPPPLEPSASMTSNLAIVGGTGAFLGARGYSGHTGTTAVGLASIADDPGIRRTRPGDEWRLTMNLIPVVCARNCEYLKWSGSGSLYRRYPRNLVETSPSGRDTVTVRATPRAHSAG